MKDLIQEEVINVVGGFGSYPGMETDINRGWCVVKGFLKGFYEVMSQ